MPAVWQCRGCGTRDTSRLSQGADSNLVCKCGAEAEGVAFSANPAAYIKRWLGHYSLGIVRKVTMTFI